LSSARTTIQRADQLTLSIAGTQKVMIAGSGHMVNMDAPVKFIRAELAAFHSKVGGSSRRPRGGRMMGNKWLPGR
jgi:pimeloyl-ACP methyl ester carboxylesterase